MRISEQRCSEIKKSAHEFTSMYKNSINSSSVRDNFLETSSLVYESREEKLLYKAFVIFNDLKEFMKVYKEYDKNIEKVAEFYDTSTDLVSYFIDVIKNMSNKEETSESIEIRKLKDEVEYLRKRILELQKELYEKEKNNLE